MEKKKKMTSILGRLRRDTPNEYQPVGHREKHFESAEVVRDAIIGLSGINFFLLTFWMDEA